MISLMYIIMRIAIRFKIQERPNFHAINQSTEVSGRGRLKKNIPWDLLGLIDFPVRDCSFQ